MDISPCFILGNGGSFFFFFLLEKSSKLLRDLFLFLTPLNRPSTGKALQMCLKLDLASFIDTLLSVQTTVDLAFDIDCPVQIS